MRSRNPRSFGRSITSSLTVTLSAARRTGRPERDDCIRLAVADRRREVDLAARRGGAGGDGEAAEQERAAVGPSVSFFRLRTPGAGLSIGKSDFIFGPEVPAAARH